MTHAIETWKSNGYTVELFYDEDCESPRESDDYYTDEMTIEQLTAEIEVYNQWANGQCYGYVITDSNGDEVVSCWGHIGYEYAKESASSAVPTKPESAVPLYPVRLTAQQLTSLGLPVPA